MRQSRQDFLPGLSYIIPVIYKEVPWEVLRGGSLEQGNSSEGAHKGIIAISMKKTLLREGDIC